MSNIYKNFKLSCEYMNSISVNIYVKNNMLRNTLIYLSTLIPFFRNKCNNGLIIPIYRNRGEPPLKLPNNPLPEYQNSSRDFISYSNTEEHQQLIIIFGNICSNISKINNLLIPRRNNAFEQIRLRYNERIQTYINGLNFTDNQDIKTNINNLRIIYNDLNGLFNILDKLLKLNIGQLNNNSNKLLNLRISTETLPEPKFSGNIRCPGRTISPSFYLKSYTDDSMCARCKKNDYDIILQVNTILQGVGPMTTKIDHAIAKIKRCVLSRYSDLYKFDERHGHLRFMKIDEFINIYKELSRYLIENNIMQYNNLVSFRLNDPESIKTYHTCITHYSSICAYQKLIVILHQIKNMQNVQRIQINSSYKNFIPNNFDYKLIGVGASVTITENVRYNKLNDIYNYIYSLYNKFNFDIKIKRIGIKHEYFYTNINTLNNLLYRFDTLSDELGLHRRYENNILIKRANMINNYNYNKLGITTIDIPIQERTKLFLDFIHPTAYPIVNNMYITENKLNEMVQYYINRSLDGDFTQTDKYILYQLKPEVTLTPVEIIPFNSYSHMFSLPPNFNELRLNPKIEQERVRIAQAEAAARAQAEAAARAQAEAARAQAEAARAQAEEERAQAEEERRRRGDGRRRRRRRDYGRGDGRYNERYDGRGDGRDDERDDGRRDYRRYDERYDVRRDDGRYDERDYNRYDRRNRNRNRNRN